MVVNTDKGLCGGLNANIVKEALRKAAALREAGKTVEFYLVGKKGRAPIKRANASAAMATAAAASTARREGDSRARPVPRRAIIARARARLVRTRLFFGLVLSAALI